MVVPAARPSPVPSVGRTSSRPTRVAGGRPAVPAAGADEGRLSDQSGRVARRTHPLLHRRRDDLHDRPRVGSAEEAASRQRAGHRLEEPPTIVVWGNARYQHTPLVRNIARCAGIDLVYLPPYSPNLNLIERVWKFTKKTALANRTFADYPAFRTAIDSTLDQVPTTHQAKMKSLLTLNFETLEKASISPA